METEPLIMSAEDFAAECAGRDDLCILDVRSPGECEAMSLTCDFLNIPLGEIDSPGAADRLAIFEGKPLYILCKAGVRARRAADYLTGSGRKNVIVIEGGIDALERLGVPVSGA